MLKLKNYSIFFYLFITLGTIYSNSPIPWETSSSVAFSRAEKEGKSVLVLITAPSWCSWCIKFEDNVLSNKSVQKAIIDNFIPLKLLDKVNNKRNPELDNYQFSGYPTVRIYDKNKGEVADVYTQESTDFIQKITNTVGKVGVVEEVGCIDGNCKNGLGTFIFNNGNKYIGSFKNGKMDGLGTYIYKNGAEYSGKYKNGERTSGIGKFKYTDGWVYDGQWGYGWKSGNQVLMQNGIGKLYNPEGDLLREGVFYDNSFYGAEADIKKEIDDKINELISILNGFTSTSYKFENGKRVFKIKENISAKRLYSKSLTAIEIIITHNMESLLKDTFSKVKSRTKTLSFNVTSMKGVPVNEFDSLSTYSGSKIYSTGLMFYFPIIYSKSGSERRTSDGKYYKTVKLTDVSDGITITGDNKEELEKILKLLIDSLGYSKVWEGVEKN